MAKATDFKTTKETEKSLWKGPGFSKKPKDYESAPVQRPRNTVGGIERKEYIYKDEQPVKQEEEKISTQIDFDSLSDDDKSCYAYAAQRYDGLLEPRMFSNGSEVEHLGLDKDKVRMAAEQIKRTMLEKDIELKDITDNDIPWWSAARDWNLELFRGGNAGKMFRPNPDMARAAQNTFRY